MAILTEEEKKEVEADYAAVMKLVEKRQSFEKNHPEQPYLDHPTTIDFQNSKGWSLFHLAIKLNDPNKIIWCLQQGAHLGKITKHEQFTPLSLAFQYAEPSLIKLFLDKLGYSNFLPFFTTVFCSQCNEKTKAIYNQCVKIILGKITNEVLENLTSLTVEEDLSKRSYLDYAIELGDIETLEKFFADESIRQRVLQLLDFYVGEKIKNPLISAVENQQHKVLDYLLNYLKPDLYSKFSLRSSFYTTALHIAAKLGDMKSVEILLAKGANPNQQDTQGKTALYYALENGHENLALQLIEHPQIQLDIKTGQDQNYLHAAKECSQTIKSKLCDKGIKDTADIFGLAANSNTPQYHYNQAHVIDIISYYHKLQYRDCEYLSEEGYCNGLVFLYHYYKSRNQRNIFYTIFEEMLNWDGSPEGLKKQLSAPLDVQFNTFEDMMEYFINIITWYQHDELLEKETEIKQSERQQQFDIPLNMLFREIEYLSVGKDKLQEFYSIFSRLPEKCHIENGGDGHIVAAEVKNGLFDYYDPNHEYSIDNALTAKQIQAIIIETKLKALRGRKVALKANFKVYSFPWENLDFTNYAYFKAEEYPSSKQQVLEFIKTSPNQFSPLHVASLTHSYISIHRLLQDGYCDINQRDGNRMTAFDIAVRSSDLQFCKIFLQHKDIDLNNADCAVDAYIHGDHDIVNLIIAHPNSKNLSNLFDAAVKCNDISLVQTLISQGKVQDLTIAKHFLFTKYIDQKVTDILEVKYTSINKEILFNEIISRVGQQRIDTEMAKPMVEKLLLELPKKLNITPMKFEDFGLLLQFISNLSQDVHEGMYLNVFSAMQAELNTLIPDMNGQTLLHAFIQRISEDKNILTAIHCLLRFDNVDINTKDLSGETPLSLLVNQLSNISIEEQDNYREILQILCEKINEEIDSEVIENIQQLKSHKQLSDGLLEVLSLKVTTTVPSFKR